MASGRSSTELDMTERRFRLCLLFAFCVISAFFAPTGAHAQRAPSKGWGADIKDPNATVKVRGETGPNGIDFQMTARRNLPGDRDRDEHHERPAGPPPVSRAPEPPP